MQVVWKQELTIGVYNYPIPKFAQLLYIDGPCLYFSCLPNAPKGCIKLCCHVHWRRRTITQSLYRL